MNRAPSVSRLTVLMAVYNPTEHLLESIESCLMQSYERFELVLINDGSTEALGLDLLKRVNDERIKLIQIHHQGLAAALNYGLRKAQGEYIARMDADDIALPDRFQKQVKFLDQNPEIAVLGTGYQVLRYDGSRKAPNVPLLADDSKIRNALPKFNPIFHGSTMIRKTALLEVGGYDESFTLAQDYDLWLRLSKKYSFANIDEVLMLRREDKSTVQKESRQNWFGIKARIKAICQGNLKWWHAIYLIRPFLVVAAPIWLKSTIRKTLLRHD